MVADIQFMFDMEERLLALTPTTMVDIGTMLTSIGQSSHVWNSEALEKKILVDIPSEKVRNDSSFIFFLETYNYGKNYLKVTCSNLNFIRPHLILFFQRKYG